MTSPAALPALRFGVFEVDLRAGELRKQGLKVKLHDQPFQILAMLLERPGVVITREELRQRLWPGDTFVDFDHGLNNAINRLREALGDAAEAPRFVETLPRRGYRFVAPVQVVAPATGPGVESSSAVRPAPGQVARKAGVLALGVAAILLLLLAVDVGGWRRRLLPRPKPGPIQSLAVLPLENLTGDPAQEYFVDGMTDALITDLAKIGSLRVISRTSAMHYKGAKKPLPEIARELKVDAVVEGSVVRSGNRVRITAQLVYAPTDQHLWANDYERDLKDVLALQSEVARDVAQQIQAKLTPQEQVRVTKVGQCAPQAHDLVLQGLYHWFRATPEGYEKSREYFEQAIELDANCAQAYSGLGQYYAIAADEGLLPPQDGWMKAREVSQRAIALDETLDGPHIGLGAASLLLDWNWAEAEKEFRKALELNPSWSDGHREYSVYLRTVGRVDEAIAEARRAQELDPFSVSMSASLGWAYFYGHRWNDAIAQFRNTLGMDPNFLAAHEGLAKCYQQKGMEKEAIDELEQELKAAGDPDTARDLRQTYDRTGYRTAMRMLYQLKLQQFQQAARQTYVSPLIFADLYALLDDKEQAFPWLEKAYRERSSKLTDLRLDPDFDSLRSDPRFANLVRRIGLP